MNPTGKETTLAQERLHWAILTIPASAAVALRKMTLPGIIVTYSMSEAPKGEL